MIPLIGGDPGTGPATSTRFVLPFAYEPEAWDPAEDDAKLHYEFENCDIGDSWRWRHDYFTPETADVLYRHARWAKLVGAESLGDFVIPGLKEPVSVRVAPPALILFEWPDGGSGKTGIVDASVLQTGFLVVDLFFPDPGCAPVLTDLLLLNERFRYWRQPWKEHPDDSDRLAYRGFLGEWPVDFLDPGRRIRCTSAPDIYFTRWASLLELPVRDGRGRTWRLFPREWAGQARRWVANEGDPEHADPRSAGWIAYADTRTFVWTCAVARDGGNALRRWYRRPLASDLAPWIQLLNVDPPRDMATAFEREWARARTYGRWEAEGTFYGFAYHAAAMLGPPWTDPPLWRIFGAMYFDQTLLLLYLRVTTFRFSYELSRISSRALRRDLAEFSEEFRRLRRSFALFTNLYEFPLLSQQQQAIEMYTLARRNMDVHELFEEIREEIQSSQAFVDLTSTTRLTLAASRLGVVAAFGTVGAVVTGLLGMNVFDAHAKCVLPSWLRTGWPSLDDGAALTLCGFASGSFVLFLVSLLVIGLFFWVVWSRAGRLPVNDAYEAKPDRRQRRRDAP